jgi:hypothetical protein
MALAYAIVAWSVDNLRQVAHDRGPRALGFGMKGVSCIAHEVTSPLNINADAKSRHQTQPTMLRWGHLGDASLFVYLW